MLRFPRGQTTADLVLGQPNFNVNGRPQTGPNDTALNKMFTPTLARVNPRTGELFVVDEYPGGFPARILVFEPRFANGMAAARRDLSASGVVKETTPTAIALRIARDWSSRSCPRGLEAVYAEALRNQMWVCERNTINVAR